MRKSSRFWWLHGAILLSAAIGCKNCGGGSCGPSAPSGGSPYSGTASSGPIGGAGGSLYSQNSTPGYPAGGAMSGAPAFSSSPGANYPIPNMASTMPQGLGGTR